MAMFNVQGNPDGSQKNGRVGLFSAGNAFNPAASDAYASTAEYLKNNPLTYNNAPALPGANDFSEDRKRIEDALLGRAKGELDTRYAQESQAFEQSMANQGVDSGSERYRREKLLFDKARNEAYNDAGFRAMLAGGDEQSRLFGLGLSARQQAISEADAQRASRLNDMAAVLNPALQMEGLANDRDIANMQNETQRYGIDRNFEASGLDRASREALARLQDETQRYGYDRSFQTGQLDREARAALQDDDQAFNKRENKLNRRLEQQRINKSGAGGGGGGALDLNQLLALVESMTGEKLSG